MRKRGEPGIRINTVVGGPSQQTRTLLASTLKRPELSPLPEPCPCGCDMAAIGWPQQPCCGEHHPSGRPGGQACTA
jgi:hypothetical protein